MFLLAGAGSAWTQQSQAPPHSAPVPAQPSPVTASGNAQPASSAGSGSHPEPMATFKATSRLVTVEVVAKDHKGQPVKGLTVEDFQVFEQEAGWRKEKRQQKIALVQPVNILDRPADRNNVQLAPGIHTNMITLQQNPVPPTIMLVDALNTSWANRVQVRIQMVRMLRTIPDDVPVAVFLLGRQLRLLQNFTTDPKLLKSALEKTSSLQASSLVEIDPRDDPDSLSAILEEIPGAQVDAIKGFEQEAFASTMDTREKITVDALRSLARHVAGYPGRKNLLWISSSFPIALNPDFEAAVGGTASLYGLGTRNYQQDMREVANLLGDAKVAVYPIDPAGLETSSLSSASTRVRGSMANGSNVRGIITREGLSRQSRVDTMETLADETGGRVCVDDNDLGDCVRKAVEDGSYFYEIAYYPDSKDWRGEYRKIVVEAKQHGIHLSYRKGYYASPEPVAEKDTKRQDEQLQKAACWDLLTSTSVLLATKELPQEQPGSRKYFLSVDTGSIGVDTSPDGAPRFELQFAACTFDKSGKPLQFWHDSISQDLTSKQYAGVESHHGYPHILAVSPAANAIAVRFLVRDLTTGRVGSVNVPLVETAAVGPTSSAVPPASVKDVPNPATH